ncbi:MAG: hypothetical protein ACI8XG_001311 [Congregibacter sp.]|jgi:hypothetical protein
MSMKKGDNFISAFVCERILNLASSITAFLERNNIGRLNMAIRTRVQSIDSCSDTPLLHILYWFALPIHLGVTD